MKLGWTFVTAVLAFWPGLAAAAPRWETYSIPESGARVDIPMDVFTIHAGDPESGIGTRLLTGDKRANLTIQSFANTSGESPAGFLKRKNPPPNIVYRRVTPNFFVVSSFRNRMIWYNRCNFAGRYTTCVLMNYPASEKRAWDAIVTRISNSLSVQ